MAFIAQLEEDRTTLLAAKATEERRFQELVRALGHPGAVGSARQIKTRPDFLSYA